MKYLASFEPNKYLSNLILSQNNLVLPGSGLHSTLCVFEMDPRYEGILDDRFSKIYFDSFEIETLDFDNFDNDALVLKLSRSDKLFDLHENILSKVKIYAEKSFEKNIEKYFGENYSPHMTISESSLWKGEDQELIGQKDFIFDYSLKRKNEGKWETVNHYYSNHSKCVI